MFLVTIPDVITLTVSHISFQLFVIERIIFGTLSDLLKIPFDYVPRSLFISKDLILGWIPLVEMETKANSHPYKHELVDVA